MKDFRYKKNFICHISIKGKSSNLLLKKSNSPQWTESLRITWDAPDNFINISQNDSGIHLTIQNITGDSKEIHWHPESNRVTLHRANLWSKPFYFYMNKGDLLISDSLRLGVHSLPSIPALDFEALDTYLALEFFPAPLTPFKGIRKVGVEETCYINLADGMTKYVTAPMPQRDQTEFNEATEEVWNALSKTIKQRIRECPNELVLLCSGGLDSSIMAQNMIGRGKAVVLSYIDSWKDETLRAKHTAQSTKLPLTEIKMPLFDSSQIAKYAELLDEPLGGTCGFAIRRLCTSIPKESWVIAGHGSGALSLTNFKNKHYRDALESGSEELVAERFCRRATFMDAATCRMLLRDKVDSQHVHPILKMIERELPTQPNKNQAILAVIRRQLCVEEEMSQIWPLYEAFGHTPVMPFFEPEVRSVFDRIPVSALRNKAYERRLLEKIARRHCPSYIPPPRQLGYGLPMGLPGYPDAFNMKGAVETYSNGPFNTNGILKLLHDSKGKEGAELFNRLRRLWTVVIFNAWFERIRLAVIAPR